MNTFFSWFNFFSMPSLADHFTQGAKLGIDKVHVCILRRPFVGIYEHYFYYLLNTLVNEV